MERQVGASCSLSHTDVQGSAQAEVLPTPPAGFSSSAGKASLDDARARPGGTEMKRKPKARTGRTDRAKKRQGRARPSVKSRAPTRRATPSTRPLAEKLRVRAGTAIAVLHCPKPPDALLGPLPTKASVQLSVVRPADLVLRLSCTGQEVGS